MFQFLELEETVGKFWHRLVGGAASYPQYPEQAASLDDVRNRLAVFFRGLGGEAGVQLAPLTKRASSHRLSVRQKLGLGEERLEQPGRDAATLFLPPKIALFPSRDLNEALYLWLGAWFAHVPVEPLAGANGFARDVAMLQRAQAGVSAILVSCPGLAPVYARLAQAMAAARPVRKLPLLERMVEEQVMALLKGDAAAGLMWPGFGGAGKHPRLPPDYQSVLPVPLWPDSWPREADKAASSDEEQQAASSLAASDTRKHTATRRKEDSQQRDPFILNRFEKILSMAEMVNVDRPDDDSKDEDAEKALDDFDELPLSNRKGKPATRLKFDLDLAPQEADLAALSAPLTYPEWDYGRRTYLKDHCRVVAQKAAEEGEQWQADDEARRRIRRVRRQFEALRPKHEILRAQPDGEELDIDALVRARSDLRAGGAGSSNVHLASRKQAHDLAVTILVDVSLSTDAWIDNCRVLDVEKEALMVLAHGIEACGDSQSILTFTSRRRNWVRVETVKGFDEPMGDRVVRRISALKPGYYTRIGAAMRHAAADLAKRPNRKKLLLVLTDGKPNDVDHYEGRFGIEDTRKAVIEARREGLSVFGVTVDAQAQSYFPTIFGRGGYAIVGRIARLPQALPLIYRHLTA